MSSVEVVGAHAAADDLRRWADQLGPAVVKASEPFAERVARVVAGKVPILSGQLASSIGVESDDESVGVTLGDGVDYAGWIEFGGTRGRSYVPDGRYLYPSALEARDEFNELAADTANDTASRFPWSTQPTI